MFEEDKRASDHGPWTATLADDGRLMLSSDDFHHDAQAVVSGDFGSPVAKLAYGQFLANVLTRGCRRAQAGELEDSGYLLRALASASSLDRELLERVCDELASLRVALSEAEDALVRLQAHRYFTDRTAQAAQPSAFAAALAEALKATK